MCSDVVHVAVGVIRNDKYQVLISKRPDDVHLGGFWEFPGGKVDSDESVEDALYRELKEELDIVPGDMKFQVELGYLVSGMYLVSLRSAFLNTTKKTFKP